MGKNLWLGRYELIMDNVKKFSEHCSIESNFNKKFIEEAGKPDKVVLWNFICNPRDKIMKVGWQNPPIMGYDNEDYLTFFQRLCQRMWTIFEPIFKRYIPIVPLSKANEHNLYGEKCLREQFPGPSFGNAPGYPGGAFNKRQIGGWRWFSLITDFENWNGEWYKQLISKKLTLKEKIAEDIAPKYYHSYTFSKGKWRDKKNGRAMYKCPSGCNFIPRRYSLPAVFDTEESSDFIERYKRFTNIILKKLKTQFTLNVWNILSFNYKQSEVSETISIRPEINIGIGWIETYALGKKKWGNIGEGLHRHYENLYNVRVGLPDNYKIELKPIINREKNPIWDGTIESIAKILEDPYSKLVDLAGIKLNKLILDALSEFKQEKKPIY